MSNGYRYTGSGERPRGIPARDISHEEFDRMGPLEQRRVRESGVFAPVKAAKPEPAKDDDKKGAE